MHFYFSLSCDCYVSISCTFSFPVMIVTLVSRALSVFPFVIITLISLTLLVFCHVIVTLVGPAHFKFSLSCDCSVCFSRTFSFKSCDCYVSIPRTLSFLCHAIVTLVSRWLSDCYVRIPHSSKVVFFVVLSLVNISRTFSFPYLVIVTLVFAFF